MFPIFPLSSDLRVVPSLKVSWSDSRFEVEEVDFASFTTRCSFDNVFIAIKKARPFWKVSEHKKTRLPFRLSE